MLYDDLISYNESNVAYNGTLILNVLGLSNPIIVNNARVIISTSEDFSNFTTGGIITYDVNSYGLMTMEVTDEQASAIIDAEFIIISTSAESQVSNSSQNRAITEIDISSIETAAEIKVTNISTSGTLYIP
jgi:hypothetical protein